MKHIVIPTDFSKNASKALYTAIAIAEKTKAKLTVLHTYNIPASTSEVMITNVIDIMREDALKEMENLKSQISNVSIEINYQTRHSDLVPALKRLCDEGADFVVMGTKGATGLEGAIFGSNTVSTIKNIKKPVLIIGQTIEKIDIGHIVLAHDNKEFTNQDDIKTLNEITDAYNASITLLNVIKPGENHLDRQEKINRYQLISELKSNDIRVKVVKNESVVDGIHEFVSEHQTELLVLIKRDMNVFEKLFHKSVTSAISKKAEIPLLILHN